jgi:DNA-binding NarL/FixJ family response regulator
LPLNILLVDDNVSFCDALRRWIGRDPDLNIVGAAHDGREAILLAAQLHPDIVLMDISMPELNGIDATRAITSTDDKVRVIGMSLFAEKSLQAAMRGAGACSFVSKEHAARDLLTAIHTVAGDNVEK